MKSYFIVGSMMIHSIYWHFAVAIFRMVNDMYLLDMKSFLVHHDSSAWSANFVAANNNGAVKYHLISVRRKIKYVVLWVELVVQSSHTFHLFSVACTRRCLNVLSTTVHRGKLIGSYVRPAGRIFSYKEQRRSRHGTRY